MPGADHGKLARYIGACSMARDKSRRGTGVGWRERRRDLRWAKDPDVIAAPNRGSTDRYPPVCRREPPVPRFSTNNYGLTIPRRNGGCQRPARIISDEIEPWTLRNLIHRPGSVTSANRGAGEEDPRGKGSIRDDASIVAGAFEGGLPRPSSPRPGPVATIDGRRADRYGPGRRVDSGQHGDRALGTPGTLA